MTEPVAGPAPSDDRAAGPGGLGRAVAVVVIAAGVVFIVAVVFFFGLLLGGSGWTTGTCPSGGDGWSPPSSLPPTPTPGPPRP